MKSRSCFLMEGLPEVIQKFGGTLDELSAR
jgi:hypothetical protein